MGKAAGLFHGDAEQTLQSRVTPSAEQREFLQNHWNALAEHLKDRLKEKYGYSISTWIQGSYKFGTLIRPVRKGDEYDVDVGIYFEWSDGEDATPAARQLRDWVQAELYDYQKSTPALKRVEDPPKERCSRAVYEQQFHIDTPVYHLQSGFLVERRRLACWSDKWENSDPKTLYKWFRDAVTWGDRDQLRRLVRYLKGWAAVAFEDARDSQPSSVLLTILVAEAYASEFFLPYISMADDDALIAVIRRIHDRLFEDRKVPNPADDTEDLNRISERGWEGFLPRLQALRDAADRADEATDEASAALAWSEVFAYLMPLPEADQVEMVEEQSGRAVMQLPEIEIEAFTRDPKRSLGKYRNEVPSVPKECDLVFTIINPHIIPAFATVEWTVRNAGTEADAVGDLGHRRGGIRMFSMDEQTSYAGRHFMDCVVRASGQVYAVRRVPVLIIDKRYPSRNPPRPSYTKLRSFIRRR